MSEEYPLRAGDADRDDAVSLLQEHLTLGRLTHEEFDERISKALSAKTQQELRELFSDLPGRRPGDPAGSSQVVSDGPGPMSPDAFGNPPPTYPPSQYPAYGPGAGFEPPRPERPWYAQWWLLIIAIVLSGVSRGNLGPLVPMTIIWLWVIWPFLVRPRLEQQQRGQRPQQQPGVSAYASGGNYPTHGSRPLTSEQRLQIQGSLTYGDKDGAIRLYQEFTGAGVPEATQVVRAMQREIEG